MPARTRRARDGQGRSRDAQERSRYRASRLFRRVPGYAPRPHSRPPSSRALPSQNRLLRSRHKRRRIWDRTRPPARIVDAPLDWCLACCSEAERARHPPGDRVLHGKDVLQPLVILLRPEQLAGESVGELHAHPDLLAGSSYAAFDNVPHVEFVTDLRRLGILALEWEDRIARHDGERPEAAECCDHVLRETVTEIFLRGIAAQIDEWKNRDAGPRRDGAGGLRRRRRRGPLGVRTAGWRRRPPPAGDAERHDGRRRDRPGHPARPRGRLDELACGGAPCRARSPPIDLHRPRDVLERALAAVLEEDVVRRLL